MLGGRSVGGSVKQPVLLVLNEESEKRGTQLACFLTLLFLTQSMNANTHDRPLQVSARVNLWV